MGDWVIVVDDDQLNLQMAVKILSRAGLRVTSLKSGPSLLDFCRKNGSPDLLLLDIKMPEMNGFEVLKNFREWEKKNGKDEIPVIFLTADDDYEKENKSFEAGASDFIRKPFVPDILIKRVKSVIASQKKILSLMKQSQTDSLTGVYNKSASSDVLPNACETRTGAFYMIDMDSFKLVNDIYGHKAGDNILVCFSDILKSYAPANSIIARFGGDEFMLFADGFTKAEQAVSFIDKVNSDFLSSAKNILGENMAIPLGISAGAVLVPEQGNEYDVLKDKADKALYHVKKNGKKGCYIYNDRLPDQTHSEFDLRSISEILGERNIPNSAFTLDKDVFTYVYQFVMRYITRNQRTACKVLFTLSQGGSNDEEYNSDCDLFEEHLQNSMRKSDVLMRNRANQYFVFLTDIHEAAITKVIDSIIEKWETSHGNRTIVSYESEFVGVATEFTHSDKYRIVVVDDDHANLKIAKYILEKAGYIVTTFKSGHALLEYIEDNIPDLILLDINMPEMDGYETLKKLRTCGNGASEIPIIYLTADERTEAEHEGLALGAMDFLKKPFIPAILLQRVRHIIDLTQLQKNLSLEIEKKTHENNELFTHVIEALAESIDAKDTYTNGHSGRVARYSREIAKRFGYSEKAQNDIYMMGLLHDVGKIGIPDAVINKPSKLNDDEYRIIKSHPEKGAKILETIKEMPLLVTGAKWHHERYSGGGYPDGLSGNDIPEEARIIAVADAYDAMSSKRSYRKPLSQEEVREEIIKGRGTQFDPAFADIMLEIIDEDVDYILREECDRT